MWDKEVVYNKSSAKKKSIWHRIVIRKETAKSQGMYKINATTYSDAKWRKRNHVITSEIILLKEQLRKRRRLVHSDPSPT